MRGWLATQGRPLLGAASWPDHRRPTAPNPGSSPAPARLRLRPRPTAFVARADSSCWVWCSDAQRDCPCLHNTCTVVAATTLFIFCGHVRPAPQASNAIQHARCDGSEEPWVGPTLVLNWLSFSPRSTHNKVLSGDASVLRPRTFQRCPRALAWSLPHRRFPVSPRAQCRQIIGKWFAFRWQF